MPLLMLILSKVLKKEVKKIIRGFRLTQQEFNSNSISISLSSKNLDTNKLASFLKLCQKFRIDKNKKSHFRQ